MITTLKSKWRAYVGPTDERIKAHENEVFARMGKFLMIAKGAMSANDLLPND